MKYLGCIILLAIGSTVYGQRVQYQFWTLKMNDVKYHRMNDMLSNSGLKLVPVDTSRTDTLVTIYLQ